MPFDIISNPKPIIAEYANCNPKRTELVHIVKKITEYTFMHPQKNNTLIHIFLPAMFKSRNRSSLF